MVKPIKLYTRAVFIDNSDCNGQNDNIDVLTGPV